MTLSDAELIEVTRKKRPGAQMRALRFMGIDHKQRADGSVLVLRAHFEQVMGVEAKPARMERDCEPDWSSFK